jgi:curved DNA-binding protein CbpA
MEPEDFQDYYATLGLQLGASIDAIKAAFRTLAMEHHPDKSGLSDSTVFCAAREAYEKLMDTDFRKAYDRTYWRKKLQTDPPAQQAYEPPFGNTRTYQYEAEMRERARRASPPPKKPFRKAGDPGWKYLNSAAYQKWQRLSTEYYARHPECDPP